MIPKPEKSERKEDGVPVRLVPRAEAPRKKPDDEEPRRVNVIGRAKEKLLAKILAFCATPRSFASIAKLTKVTEGQTRYLLRHLMYAKEIVKSGARENTVYHQARAAAKAGARKTAHSLPGTPRGPRKKAA